MLVASPRMSPSKRPQRRPHRNQRRGPQKHTSVRCRAGRIQKIRIAQPNPDCVRCIPNPMLPKRKPGVPWGIVTDPRSRFKIERITVGAKTDRPLQIIRSSQLLIHQTGMLDHRPTHAQIGGTQIIACARRRGGQQIMKRRNVIGSLQVGSRGESHSPSDYRPILLMTSVMPSQETRQGDTVIIEEKEDIALCDIHSLIASSRCVHRSRHRNASHPLLVTSDGRLFFIVDDDDITDKVSALEAECIDNIRDQAQSSRRNNDRNRIHRISFLVSKRST